MSPSGALSAPPPVPVPVQVTGVVAFASIVAPAGLEAELRWTVTRMPINNATMKVAAMNKRSITRALRVDRVRFAKLKTVGIISSTPLLCGCRAAGEVKNGGLQAAL
jgi:hypothetical protein